MWTEYDSICLSHIDMRNIQKLSQTKNDKKLVNVTRIILVDITESHDFVDFTNYYFVVSVTYNPGKKELGHLIHFIAIYPSARDCKDIWGNAMF